MVINKIIAIFLAYVHKFLYLCRRKSKRMRCTSEYITHWGSVNVSDHIAAIGTKASEGGLTYQDGTSSTYEFSEGKYGERVTCLNLENTGEGGYTLGAYHVSGARKGGTGFYVTPGGDASNNEASGRRIRDGAYPILIPYKSAKWLFPSVGGSVGNRGIRFHWGDGVAKDWTEGCFVLFTNYKLDQARNILITENNSKIAAVNFARLLGGVGTAKSSYKGRTEVLNFQYGIQDRLVLKSIWKR